MDNIITVKIKVWQNDLDRIEKRFAKTGINHLEMIEDIIQDALFDDMGLINTTTVTKIG